MADAKPLVPRHPLSWRSWRLRAAAGLIALTLAVRLVWGWHVGRTLGAQLDEVRGRGEPVAVGDVKYEAVPDAENAWDVQTRAARAHATGVDSPRNGNGVYREYPPFEPAWTTAAQASERAHTQTFALARQARGLTRVQLRDGLATPMISTLLPMLNEMRRLANTLTDGAVYAHVTGSDAEALERIGDVLHVGRSLRRDDFLVSQLVAIGTDALTMNGLQIIAPGLQLADGTPARASARRLIEELQNERPAWAGFERSQQMERLLLIDYVSWRTENIWLIRPLAQMDLVRSNRNLDVAAEAARLRDKPGVERVLARVVSDPGGNNVMAALFGRGRPTPTVPRYSRWFNVSSDVFARYFETQFKGIAERRMTAVSLAAQLYRADHGRWPARLAELTPAYLPAVPADPYRADGGPVGYVVAKLPGGAQRPLVYVDSGADVPGLIRPAPMYDWNRNPAIGQGATPVRQYRDLSRFEPPASPKAVDGNPKKSGAPGEQPE